MGDKLKALLSRSLFHLSTTVVTLGSSRSTNLIPVMLAPVYMKGFKFTALKSYNRGVTVRSMFIFILNNSFILFAIQKHFIEDNILLALELILTGGYSYIIVIKLHNITLSIIWAKVRHVENKHSVIQNGTYQACKMKVKVLVQSVDLHCLKIKATSMY